MAFSRSPLDSLLVGFLIFFLILDVALIHKQPPTFVTDKSPWGLKRVWFPSSAPPSLFFRRASGLLLEGTTLSFPQQFPPCAAHFSQVFLGRIRHALEIIFALPPHWVPLTVSLASHLFDNFSTVVWRGLATCWRRTSERTLRLGSLHALVFCFTRFHKVLGWSSCPVLSNQQACVRPCCFTGRPRPLGTGFLTGSRCYLPSCSFHLVIPNLRVPRYGLAPVDCFYKLLCHRQSYLLATCSFLSSPCTNFGPTDFCHLRRRSNLFFLICLFAFFGLNGFLMFCFASIQLRPISDYDMLTVGRSARDLLRMKIAP